MPIRIPGDPDPDDKRWLAAREKAEREEADERRKEMEEARAEFVDLEGYELAESDDLNRFATRRLFLEEQDRMRAWLIRKKEGEQ